MKHILIAACLLGATATAFAQDVGVSVTVGQPGFYGRIDIGNYPPPVVVYSQPLIIAPAPVMVTQQPVYLRVPPGHAKKWAKHCAKYNACGQPVYFVQENWYRNEYAPVYRGDRRDRGDREDRDEDRGNGNGKGKGHYKEKKNKGHGND